MREARLHEVDSNWTEVAFFSPKTKEIYSNNHFLVKAEALLFIRFFPCNLNDNISLPGPVIEIN